MPKVLGLPTMRFESWPALDQEAWQKARAPHALFDTPPRRVRRWNAVTWNSIEQAYGQWLSWLSSIRALDHATAPADRADADRVSDYVATMQRWGLADYTVHGRIENLGRALSVLAPEVDWSWIDRGANVLKSQSRKAKDVREVIRPGAELLELGHALMRSAASSDHKGGSYSSVRFRDGLLIAFLIHFPLRRRNLASLKLGVHLKNLGGGWRLEIHASETKSGVAISCALPAGLVSALECYLRDHRPVLMECGTGTDLTSNLWVSRQGRGMSSQAVYEAVCHRTEVGFGRALTPHLFRHVAATDIATASPDQALTIKSVLSHRSMAPSERHYNRASLIAAAEHVQHSVELFRQRL